MITSLKFVTKCYYMNCSCWHNRGSYTNGNYSRLRSIILNMLDRMFIMKYDFIIDWVEYFRQIWSKYWKHHLYSGCHVEMILNLLNIEEYYIHYFVWTSLWTKTWVIILSFATFKLCRCSLNFQYERRILKCKFLCI